MLHSISVVVSDSYSSKVLEMELRTLIDDDKVFLM